MECPYCRAQNQKKNIIDTGHKNIHEELSKKGNTQNIYLCPECNEVFETFQSITKLRRSVDIFMNRKFQYCRGNIPDIYTNDVYDEDEEESKK